MTTGMMMFVGGIAGIIVLTLAAIVMIPISKKRRKNLLGKIQTE